MARRTTSPADDTADADADDSTSSGATTAPDASAAPDDDASSAPAEPAASAASDDAAPDAAASAAAAASAPPAESGFFTWLRSLGVPRRDGWLGGVCGGIAERIGIDPLLVRGIVVVLAVIGAPVALLYAAAWFLLPDGAGTIHAKELGHGRVTRALPGIAVVFLLSFLPLTQSLWWAGALYWGDLGWGGAIGRVLVTLVLIAAAIVLVVWLARRASDVPTTPATTDDRPDTVPTFPADAAPDATTDAGVLAAAAATPGANPADPGEPPAPPTDASAEELAAWKQSQDAWQKQRAEWAAEQRRTDRARMQAEAHAGAVAAAEAARERRRINRLTRPRASAGVVFLVLGVALVASAVAAFAASESPDTAGSEWLVGAAVLVLVLGVGTVAVALGRRRSFALALFSLLGVLALAVAAVLPSDRATLPPGANWGLDSTIDGRYAQIGGYTTIYVSDRNPERAPIIDLWQWSGTVDIDLEEGATVRVEYTTDADLSFVTVNQDVYEGSGQSAEYRVAGGTLELVVGEGEPDAVIRVWAGERASVWVHTWTETDTPLTLSPEPSERWAWDGNGQEMLPATPEPSPMDPIPSPSPTEGAS